MRRRRLTHAVLASLLILGGSSAAGTIPAAAAGSSASTPSAPSTADPKPASDGLLAAMQRDLGLTRRQAEARIAAERAAAVLAPQVRRTAGETFAGSWFDAERGRLTVALTPDATTGTRRAIGAAGADVRTAEHSARQLDAVKTRIDRLSAPPGVSGWHVDPVANAVVVDVVREDRSDNDVRRFVSRARAAGPVTVRTGAPAPPPSAAGTQGGAPHKNGKQPSAKRVTV
ncbi:alpha-lytic protease prodomain-containing protein, partial [Streptomyces tricolor]